MISDPSPPRDGESSIREAFHEGVNRALARGALYAVALAIVTGLGAGLMALVSGDPLWRLGALFGLVAAAYAALVWRAARAGRVRGRLRYLLVVPFALLPTAYFLTAEAVYLDGAASFITGPVSYAYLFLIAVSGFLLSFRVAFVTGLVAAAGFVVCFVVARPGLLAVQSDNPLLVADLTSPWIAGFKALIFVATGVAVGGAGNLARRLMVKKLGEEREKLRLEHLFGQYVTGVVSERLLAYAAEGGGERVEVVILFSDLRGFSTFAEGRDPAEVVERLNAYLERMVLAIQAEHGVVDKFIGDAIMAVFGGLVALDSPCRSAVRAAIRMRDSLAELNAEWRAAGIEGFENGIGLHVGEVVHGPIGSHARKEFTAIGDTVNTAARLEDLTKTLPSRILVTEVVHARLEPAEQAAFEPLGQVTVKGKSEPVVVYGLVTTP